MKENLSGSFGRLTDRINDIIALRDFEKVKAERDAAVAKLKVAEERIVELERVKQERDVLAATKSEANKEAFQVIKEVCDQLDKPNPAHRTYRKEILDSNLPQVIEEHVEQVVKRRLIEAQNEALVSIWNKELYPQVNRFLEGWSSVVGRRTNEKLVKLKNLLLVHPFIALKGNWDVPCGDCPVPHVLKLPTAYDISQFLKKNSAKVPPSDIVRGLVQNHDVTLTLSELVKMYIIKSVKNTKA
jgi:hypothetical protein